MKIVAIVPLKKNSRRLKNKNFLNLNNQPLAFYIFNTLMKIKQIDEVFCYSSENNFLKFLPKGVKHLPRPKILDGNNVKANELFRYAVKKINSEFIIITHATNPFISVESIEKGINALKKNKFTCAFSVLKNQTYSWFNQIPLNYNPQRMSQTQELEPIFTETSGFYIFKKDDYLKNNTRISSKPFFVEVNIKESIDVDNLRDFNLSKKLFDYNENEKNNIFDLVFLENLPQNKLKKHIKHIAFDLDGVLIDSLDLMKKSWNYSMKKMNLKYKFSIYFKFIGFPFFEILNKIGIDKKYHNLINKYYSEYSIKNIDNIKPYKNIKKLLNILEKNKFKISIITSKNLIRTNHIIKKFFKKNKFSSIVTPERLKSKRGKPNPDSLYLACFETGVNLEQTLYIGDMKIDLLFTQKANTKFIHAKWGYEKNTYNVISANNVKELIQLFK